MSGLTDSQILIFYCTTLYARTDLCKPNPENRNLSLYLSLGIGLINFLFAIPTYWLINRSGRRALLLCTLPFMTVCMLGACLGYEKPDDSERHIGTLATFTFLFMIVYSFGMGPVPFTLSAEVFPLEYRMVGMSLAVFVNLLGAGVLALIVPLIYSSNLGNQGLLGIATGLNAVAFLLILLFVRETAGTVWKGKKRAPMSMEDLSWVFEPSTRQFWRWQRLVLLKWLLSSPLRWVKPVYERPRIEEFPLEDLSDKEALKAWKAPVANGEAQKTRATRLRRRN